MSCCNSCAKKDLKKHVTANRMNVEQIKAYFNENLNLDKLSRKGDK